MMTVKSRAASAVLACVLLLGCGSDGAIAGDAGADADRAVEESSDGGGEAEAEGGEETAIDGDAEIDVDAEPEADSGSDCEVTIPLAELSTTARFYDHESVTSPGVTVSYFAVLGSDGAPRVAFNACDVCYEARRGYSQRATTMHCNNCGTEFEIDGIGVGNTGSGCWPGYLPVTITDTDVVIRCADLEGGTWYFE